MSFTSQELLIVARDAINAQRVTDAHVVRAISSAYYAMFHHMIDASVEVFFGSLKDELRKATDHYCRSVGHDSLAKRCKAAQNPKLKFPKAIVDYAATLYDMREKRCFADYDRKAFFTRADAEQCVVEVEQRIKDFDAAPSSDRVAFIIWANFEKKDR